MKISGPDLGFPMGSVGACRPLSRQVLKANVMPRAVAHGANRQNQSARLA
jgi:hypothetical protein